MARSNARGHSVSVSLRARPELGATLAEAAAYGRHEGAFMGNLFGATPVARSCGGPGGGNWLWNPSTNAPLMAGGPAVTFSTYLGIADCDDVAHGPQGDLYLACHSPDDRLPMPARPRRERAGDMDAYVIRLDPRARKVVWATRLAGRDYDGAGVSGSTGAVHPRDGFASRRTSTTAGTSSAAVWRR
jgi:hypothetical protein